MKCSILFVVAIMFISVQAEVTISESDIGPVKDDLTAVSQEKKQEKRGIGYNSQRGYTSGLGVDGTSGYYNGVLGVGGYNDFTGVGGYNGGYYNPYTPQRVAGLGSISGYTQPGYYSNGYTDGFSGYGGYAGNGYTGGYNLRQVNPYYRHHYYNTYPSSYFNSNLGSSIVGGGLGLSGVPPTVPVIPGGGGYRYGPGISGAY